MHRSTDVSARPLLIGGMHRSGTSLTASLVASAGIDLGPELLGANESNPLGHFEDLGFQDFHRRALTARGISDEGYTATARGDVPAALEPLADELLAARMRRRTAWGWKEPRTTLFLDFWQERVPETRHLFIFRRPWEVADSLFRRGDETFLVNPTFAFDVWTHYNRLILDFVRRHPTRCLVFEIQQLIASPGRVFSTVRSKLDVPLGRPGRRYRDSHFHRDHGSMRAALVRAIAPDAWRVYLELRELAGLDDRVEAKTPSTASVGECAVLEWARASRAETELRRQAAQQPPAEPRSRTVRSAFDVVHRVPGLVTSALAAVSRRLRPAGVPMDDHTAADVLEFPRAAAAPSTKRVA